VNRKVDVVVKKVKSIIMSRMLELMRSNHLEMLHVKYEEMKSSLMIKSQKGNACSVYRNYSAESYIPAQVSKSHNVTALESDSTGNCLFSSASIHLVSDMTECIAVEH